MKRTIQEWREFFSHEPQQYWDLFMGDLFQDMEEYEQQRSDLSTRLAVALQVAMVDHGAGGVVIDEVVERLIVRAVAEEFVKLHGGDVALMHTWFANAVMAGYDEAQRRLEPDAQRYRFLAEHYGRSKDLHMDGKSRWYVNTPYLSRKATLTLAQAIDAERAEQEADTRERNDARAQPTATQ